MTGAADPRRPRKRRARSPAAVACLVDEEDKIAFDEPAMPAPPSMVADEESEPTARADDATCESQDEAVIPSSDLN